MTEYDSRFLREAGLRWTSLETALKALKRPAAQHETLRAQAVDHRMVEPSTFGAGIFGQWEVDRFGLPCFRYTLDQYADPRASYPNTDGLDRRDHWHQIGNDRITAMASNDGTIQVYFGDRGGVILNRFNLFDTADVPVSQEAARPKTLQDYLRRLLQAISRLYFRARIALKQRRRGSAPSAAASPRGIPNAEPIPNAQAVREPSRFAYSGGFGYLESGGEIWSTAYRYRGSAQQDGRVFGVGYTETETAHRDIRVTRRTYAPYGNHPLLLTDLTFENTGTSPVEFRYYEYWDINVYQLRLQWLRGDLFSITGDEERSAINNLFLPQIEWDENARALRFHQQLVAEDIDIEAVSPIDYAPADIFLADLTDTPRAYYVDKYAFFGRGTPRQPEAVQRAYETIPDAPSTDSMPYCLVMRRDIRLAPGETVTQRYAFGTVTPGQPISLEAFRKGDPLAKTVEAWKAPLAYFHTGNDPILKREMIWHAYYLLSATLYNQYYGVHLIPQGSAYLFIHGADGAPRDQALFALPLTYLRPDLARENLRLIMSLQNEVTGEIPYSFSGHGLTDDAIIHEAPSDLDLFFLLALNEYLAATGDTEFLALRVPFYKAGSTRTLPPGAQGTTVLDHARAAVYHLIERIGKGEHGLIRIGDGDWSDGVVFSNCMKLGGLAGVFWFAQSKANGESIPNTQMALYVLPLTAALLRDHDPALVEKINAFLEGLAPALESWWRDGWYARAVLRDTLNQPRPIGEDNIDLEAQPWALISEAAYKAGHEAALVEAIRLRLDDPSLTGAPLLENGMIWPAVSQLLTWGYTRRYPNLAWRSLLRHTHAAHATVFPHVWIGVWSAPDGLFCETAPENPGGTWKSAATPMTDFPVMNANPHAMALLGLLRVCGIEPAADGSGLVIAPCVPRDSFILDTPLLLLEIAPGRIAGEYRATATGTRTLTVRVPAGAVGVSASIGGEAAVGIHAQEVRLPLRFLAGDKVAFEVRWQTEA